MQNNRLDIQIRNTAIAIILFAIAMAIMFFTSTLGIDTTEIALSVKGRSGTNRANFLFLIVKLILWLFTSFGFGVLLSIISVGILYFTFKKQKNNEE